MNALHATWLLIGLVGSMLLTSRRSLIVGTSLLCALPFAAMGQTVEFMESHVPPVATFSGIHATFDWPQIKECADRPLPGLPKDVGYLREMENILQTINSCRIMLFAHHAGIVETDPNRDDPIGVVPAIRDDDTMIPYQPKKP